MVRAAARGRHRGDPRRGLQPHRRERRTRPHAQLARPGQRQLLPAAGRTARTTKPHRLRQHARPAPAARAADGDGQPALLGAARCMSTASASTWRRCSAAATTASTAHAPFFTAVAQDPLLSRLKLIAEPWDIGPGGYQLGGFPPGWLEWNDRFRDTMRAFWLERRLHARRLRAAAVRLVRHRSSRATARRPESVNFIVSHDGFTLPTWSATTHSTTRPTAKHNRDGHGHNLSWNCGVEGPDRRPGTCTRCARALQRALLATLLLSQGTPMLAAGDELGHSQGGNNNPYCQDNATTWIDWSAADEDLIAFTARLLALRQQALPLRRPLVRRPARSRTACRTWPGCACDGSDCTATTGAAPTAACLGCLIGRAGRGAGAAAAAGQRRAPATSTSRCPPGTGRRCSTARMPRGEATWQRPRRAALRAARPQRAGLRRPWATACDF